MKQVIGIIILSVVIVGLFVFVALERDWQTALAAFGFAFGLTGLILLGAWLVTS
jgi:hypothetical protein